MIIETDKYLHKLKRDDKQADMTVCIIGEIFEVNDFIKTFYSGAKYIKYLYIVDEAAIGITMNLDTWAYLDAAIKGLVQKKLAKGW